MAHYEKDLKEIKILKNLFRNDIEKFQSLLVISDSFVQEQIFLFFCETDNVEGLKIVKKLNDIHNFLDKGTINEGLDYAVFHNFVDIIDFAIDNKLFENFQDFEETFIVACEVDNIDIVRIFLKSKIFFNEGLIYNITTPTTPTLSKCFKDLVIYCDPNYQNSGGCTPLMFSFCYKNLEMIKILMDITDLSLKNSLGYNALFYAFGYCEMPNAGRDYFPDSKNDIGFPINEEYIKFILEILPRFNINEECNFGTTVFTNIIDDYNIFLDIFLDIFINYPGFDINHLHNNGCNYLMFAALSNKFKAVKKLKNHLDIDFKDKDGKTTLELLYNNFRIEKEFISESNLLTNSFHIPKRYKFSHVATYLIKSCYFESIERLDYIENFIKLREGYLKTFYNHPSNKYVLFALIEIEDFYLNFNLDFWHNYYTLSMRMNISGNTVLIETIIEGKINCVKKLLDYCDSSIISMENYENLDALYYAHLKYLENPEWLEIIQKIVKKTL